MIQLDLWYLSTIAWLRTCLLVIVSVPFFFFFCSVVAGCLFLFTCKLYVKVAKQLKRWWLEWQQPLFTEAFSWTWLLSVTNWVFFSWFKMYFTAFCALKETGQWSEWNTWMWGMARGKGLAPEKALRKKCYHEK